MDFKDRSITLRTSTSSPFSISHATPWRLPAQCGECPIRDDCLPASLKADEYPEFERIVRARRILRQGERLYRQNEPCHSIFAIRSGSIKLLETSAGGSEQVRGFFFCRHVVGFDGISAGKHTSDALAMEATAVCEIPFDALCELSGCLPGLQTSFLRMMSGFIVEEQNLLRLLGKGNAEQRVAAFLLSMSDAFRRRGLSATRILLPMARSDIASYLGTTIETVSRCFTQFARRDLIAVTRNDMHLLDMEALRTMAHGVALHE